MDPSIPCWHVTINTISPSTQSPHNQSRSTAGKPVVPAEDCCHLLSALRTASLFLLTVFEVDTITLVLQGGTEAPRCREMKHPVRGPKGRTGAHNKLEFGVRLRHLTCGRLEGCHKDTENVLRIYPYSVCNGRFLQAVSYNNPPTAPQSAMQYNYRGAWIQVARGR